MSISIRCRCRTGCRRRRPSLPVAVNNYGLVTQQTVGIPLLVFAITSPHGTWSQSFLANYIAINIEDELARIPGIGQVKLMGASNYAMRVWVAPDKLAKLQLTIADLVNALSVQNVVNPAGTIGGEPAPPGQQYTYTVSAQGRLMTAEQFGDVIVRANPDGSFVRLKDLARIDLGAENYTQQSFVNGKPAAAVLLYQNPGSNALEAANQAKARMAELARRFPQDMRERLVLDTTVPVTEGAREIVKTLLEAIALVVLVVFIFLQNWRATLIPILTIPVSLVGAFMFFPAVGFSINTLSLLGLVLAVGLVVDDAIVVVEAIESKIERGRSPRDAAIEAMDEVSGALVGIALVLSAVFIPAGFMTGLTGSLYRQFALTIAFSVLLSAFNALTLSPALGAMILRPRLARRRRGPLEFLFGLFNAGFERAQNGYVRICGLLVRKVGVALIILGGFVLLAGGLGETLSRSFLPDEDQGYFMVNVELPEAASLQRTLAVMRTIDAVLRTEPAIQYVSGIAGYSMLSQTSSPRNAFFFCSLKPYDERMTAALQAGPIIESVNRKLFGLPGAIAFAFPPPAIPGIGQASGVDFFIQDRAGHDVDYLWSNTAKFLAAARKRPELGQMNLLFTPAVPQLFAAVDKDKAFKLGVPINDVYEELQSLARRLLRESIQPLRAGVESVRRSGAALSEQSDRRGPVLCAQQQRRNGSAIDARHDETGHRSGIHHPFQRIPQHRDFRRARARLQHRRRDEGDQGGVGQRAAAGYGLRLERHQLPAVHRRGRRGRVRAVDRPGLSHSRRAVSELVAAVQRAAQRAGGRLRRIFRALVAPLRQRHIRASRPDHADWIVGEECDSDRRIRQGRTRKGRIRDRRGAERSAPAATADPHDLVRIHLRPGAAVVRAGRGRHGPAPDRHRHYRGHGVFERDRDFSRAAALRHG